MQNNRYISTPYGVGGWLSDLFGTSAGQEAAQAARDVTAKIEAQCKASGGTVVGDRCLISGAAPIRIPQPSDAIPGVPAVKEQIAKAAAGEATHTATQAASEAAKKGAADATKTVLVTTALVIGVAWLVLR